MLSGPSRITDADPLATPAMLRAISNDAFSIVDVAFRTFPAIHAVASTTPINPVAAAE